MKKFSEFLLESRTGFLYHSIHQSKLQKLVDQDLLEAVWDHNIPGKGIVRGISFTRNKRFLYSDRSFLVFDAAKLSANNKITPVDAERIFSHTAFNTPISYRNAVGADVSSVSTRKMYKGKTPYEQPQDEEFIVGDIKNVSKKLVEIVVYDELQASEHGRYNIREYCDKYGVKMRDLSKKYRKSGLSDRREFHSKHFK